MGTTRVALLGTLHALAVEPNNAVQNGYEGESDHKRSEELYVRNPYKLLWEPDQDHHQSPKYNPSCDENPSKHGPAHTSTLLRRIIWGR